MPLHVSSKSDHRQEAKIASYSLWYHHTYRWPSRGQVERGLKLVNIKINILRCTVSKILKKNNLEFNVQDFIVYIKPLVG